MIPNWRLYAIVILLLLSVVDLVLTYTYVHRYKEWQPFKPYSLIENNPLLTLLWNNFGVRLGTFIGSVIILSLIYLVGKSGHWIIVLILFLALCWTNYNHVIMSGILNKLIERYPSGYLPEIVFGTVVGNNLKKKREGKIKW